MNRNRYRLCLAVVIVLAVASGILYYQFCQKQNATPKEGVFVWQEQRGSEAVWAETAKPFI